MPSNRAPVAFGQYIITRRIARGGMAEIYRARTRSTSDQPSRWVAVKMMRPSIGHEELREHLFKREARIASAIDHPNVIPLYQFGLEMDRHYIAMEYVRGRDLSHLLKNEKKGRELLPFELGLFIGLQAAAGLGHAHRLTGERGESLGIVHRDISPGNVMVGYDGQVKVLDFGVARMNESEGMRTQTGTLRGKFAYMSPEQTLGENLDARSDVFSLGTVLYELLTGANCFRADNPIATLERVQRVRPVPPSRANREIPKSVDRILARCLAKDRKRRFQDCVVLHEAIGEFLDKRNFAGRGALARHMGERFEWEKSEEEKELQREEEEVAIFDVVDFALVGEDGGLDAPHVAVSLEEEASQSEVNKAGLKGSADEEEQVFDSDDPDEQPATEHSGRIPPRMAEGAIPSDPDASEYELTVAQPRSHFVDPDEAAEEVKQGRALEASSLFERDAAPSSVSGVRERPQPPPDKTAPMRMPTPPAPAPRVSSPPKKSEHAGQVLIGMRAPEFGGLLGPAGVREDQAGAQLSTAVGTTSETASARKQIPRPAILIAALVASVLLVATLVTMGIESQSKGEAGHTSAAQAAVKRTTIAPVTITLDDAAKKAAGKAEHAEVAEQEHEPEKDARAMTRSAVVHAPDGELPEGDEVDPPAGDADEEEKPAAKAREAKEPRDPPQKKAQHARPAPVHEKVKERERPDIGSRLGKAEPPVDASRSRPVREEPSQRIASLVPRIVPQPVKPPPKGKPIGYLNVGAKPWAEISIDQKPWPYQTPQAGIELTVGKHTITLFNRETGVTKSQVVQIKQGEYKTISVDMHKK